MIKHILIGAGLLVAVALLAWPKLRGGTPAAGATQPAAGNQAPLRVEAVVVEPQPLQDRLVTTGTILANEEVELRSEATGRIVHLAIEEGRRVQAGELLLKVNDQELQAQLQQARLRLRLAEDREQRQRQLLAKQGISQETYDATVNERDVQRAAVALIEAQIARTELRAPFDGLIGLRYVSEGSYISPSTRIATLQDIGTVKVEFSIPERHAHRVRVGNRIAFTVEGVEGTFEGRIYAYEPRIDAATRTLRLRARAANPQGRLLPGAFARVEVVFEEIPDALTVPAIAVIPVLGGKQVFVYRAGRAVVQPVETGLRLEDRVQVVAGLAPGDTVITSGLLQLRSGLPVELAGFDLAAPGTE